MYVNIDLDKVKDDISEFLQKVCNEEIKNKINNDNKFLKEIIRECIRGQVKSAAIEVLQSPTYKQFIIEKINQQIGIKENPFDDEYFEGLTYEDIAHLAKKSIRLTTENSELTHKLEELSSKVDDCLGIDCAWCMNVNCPKEKKGKNK